MSARAVASPAPTAARAAPAITQRRNDVSLMRKPPWLMFFWLDPHKSCSFGRRLACRRPLPQGGSGAHTLSHRLPPPAPGRAEEGVDDTHVLHGVFERKLQRLTGADRLGEEIALDGVLVADPEGLL